MEENNDSSTTHKNFPPLRKPTPSPPTKASPTNTPNGEWKKIVGFKLRGK